MPHSDLTVSAARGGQVTRAGVPRDGCDVICRKEYTVTCLTVKSDNEKLTQIMKSQLGLWDINRMLKEVSLVPALLIAYPGEFACRPTVFTSNNPGFFSSY